MTTKSIEQRVAELIAKDRGLKAEEVKQDVTLFQLGLDEFDGIDIELDILAEFGVSLPESIEDATVAQICAAVRAMVEEQT